MWPYEFSSRVEFDKRKEYVEAIMIELGAEIYECSLPYEDKTTTYTRDFTAVHKNQRKVFFFDDRFYRVDELLYAKKPSIVIECGDEEQLNTNAMDDADPFPFDLPDDEIRDEVKYSMGIEPYPTIE